MPDNKQKIINLFLENVYNKKPNLSSFNEDHDGKNGHWLEQQFGITANGDNAPDLYGYELKNETTSGKTTFGDWGANYYIFNDKKYNHIFSGKNSIEKRKNFFKFFGKYNIEKHRYSWSGSPCPKYPSSFNEYGQQMIIENGDIKIIYNHQMNQYPNEDFPEELKNGTITLAKWDYEKLKAKVENKFNQNGWFKCKTDSNGYYNKICFGAPFNYASWLELLKTGIVFFDSGMYEGNSRPYSQWRASNSYWNSLILETYPK